MLDKKAKLITYLQEQIAQADFKARAYVFDQNNNKVPTRNYFVKLQMYLTSFLKGDPAVRWIVLSGFRGVGKTTLLSQLYFENSDPEINRLYLAVDHVTQSLGVTLDEVLSAYEELLGTVFERLDKKTILFLDEVQYDKKWALTLKTLYDRSTKVFTFATGSSALSLQENADAVRRSIAEKVFPMSFTEYLKIKGVKFDIKGLGSQIRAALFESSTAVDVYRNLRLTEPLVRKYWTGIDRLEIDRYMKYGTLPFAVLFQRNEGLIYEQIRKIIDRVIRIDIVDLGQFKKEIINRIAEVLYAIAASDSLSVTNLAKDMTMDRGTLIDILATLEKSEVLTRIYPYGAHATQVRKPSKYLFASPAFRSMEYSFIGNTIAEPSYMGKLLEDTVGFYLDRYLSGKNYSLTYDSAQSGADFIVRRGLQNIILEAGYGEKGFTQIENTTKRIGAKYGIAVSMSPLRLNPEKTAVTVPLSYFLLL